MHVHAGGVDEERFQDRDVRDDEAEDEGEGRGRDEGLNEGPEATGKCGCSGEWGGGDFGGVFGEGSGGSGNWGGYLG